MILFPWTGKGRGGEKPEKKKKKKHKITKSFLEDLLKMHLLIAI